MMALVTGGRGYKDSILVFRMLDETLKAYPNLIVIHGGASGADSIAAQWAAVRQIPCFMFPARWARCGKAAGPMRNREMLAFLQKAKDTKMDHDFVVLAFPTPGEDNTGTRDMMKIAREAGFEVIDVEARKNQTSITSEGEDEK